MLKNLLNRTYQSASYVLDSECNCVKILLALSNLFLLDRNIELKLGLYWVYNNVLFNCIVCEHIRVEKMILSVFRRILLCRNLCL